MKNSEKKFLHDIMSPLAGMSMIIESLQDDLPVEKEWQSVHQRLKAIADGMEKVRASIIARQAENEDSNG